VADGEVTSEETVAYVGDRDISELVARDCALTPTTTSTGGTIRSALPGLIPGQLVADRQHQSPELRPRKGRGQLGVGSPAQLVAAREV
jgi:hypothetical protein